MMSTLHDSNDDRSPAELLYAEFLRQKAGGEPIDLDSFCSDHPEHQSALRVIALADGGDNSLPPSRVEELIRQKLGGESKPEQLPDGHRVDRYTIRREVARGGMGVIYEVWDDVLGRSLAMKVIQDSEGVERFLNEARVTGRLEHPGVVPVHDLGRNDHGDAYFTMPLLDGDGLDKVLKKVKDSRDNWTLTRALGVLLRVCDTLAYAHSRGVIHRDLKPENIIVGRFGETYVMDWGLAKFSSVPDDQNPVGDEDPRTESPSSSSITVTGTVMGTPAYMPPEQAAGDLDELDERSDVYAVGAVLYSLLVGRPPYTQSGERKSSKELVKAVLGGPPDRIETLANDASPELVAICEKAMSRIKEDRYRAMNELGDDLRAFLENRVVRAYRTGAMAELQKWVGRNRAIAATIAVLIVGLAAFLGWREVTRRELENERNQKNTALTTAKRVLLEKDNALRRSEANRLTARSAAELRNDPTLSLLLALEGAALEPGRTANNALLASLAELRERRTIIGHEGRVYNMDVSPDGLRVVSVSADDTALVSDVETGDEICRFVTEKNLLQCRFGIDGTRVYVSGRTTLYVFDAKSGEQIGSRQFAAREGECAPLPDRDRVLLANHGMITTLDAESLETKEEFAVEPRDIYWLDVSPDGRYALVGGDPSGHKGYSILITTLWDLHERKLVHSFDGYFKARFNRDGSAFIAGTTETSSGGTAVVVETKTGKVLRAFEGHGAQMGFCSFSYDDRLVATCSRDGTVRIWDNRRGDSLAVMTAHESDVIAVDFARSRRLFVSGSDDMTVRVWGLEPTLTIDSIPGPVDDVAPVISSDGRSVLTWPARDIEIRDVASGALIRSLTGHTTGVWFACFSPDASLVASTSWDGEARLWNSATGSQVGPTLLGHTGRIYSASFDRQGERIVTASSDGSARVWDIKTGETLHTLRIGRDVDFAAFSRDGQRVVAGSHDYRVRVWDLRTGEIDLNLKPHQSTVTFVAFSADDSILMTGSHDNTACVLDARSGDIIAPRLVGHEGSVVRVDHHAEKNLIVTLSLDGTARLWDMRSGKELLTIRSSSDDFRWAAFSVDGRWIYTLEGADNLKRWPVDPVAVALQNKPRELTPDERARFEIGSAEERQVRRMIERLRSRLEVSDDR